MSIYAKSQAITLIIQTVAQIKYIVYIIYLYIHATITKYHTSTLYTQIKTYYNYKPIMYKKTSELILT